MIEQNWAVAVSSLLDKIDKLEARIAELEKDRFSIKNIKSVEGLSKDKLYFIKLGGGYTRDEIDWISELLSRTGFNFFLMPIKSDGAEFKFDIIDAKKLSEPCFDLDYGDCINGIVIWNRAQVDYRGEYINVAFINDRGDIEYYIENIPKMVVNYVEQVAKEFKQKLSKNEGAGK